MLNENQKIWRYLDFCKFESMLEKKALFFSKASEMQDKEEGHSPKMNLMAYFAENDPDDPDGSKEFRDIRQSEHREEKDLQRRTFMTCWRIDDRESPKAWDEYIGNQEGVVIQSTYGKLKGCLKERYRVYADLLRTGNLFEENSIFLEKVEYRNYPDRIGNKTPQEYLRLYTGKQPRFKWENELRAFLVLPNEVEDSGFDVPIDLEYLIENIYVSPKVQNILEKAKTLTERYSLKVDVKNPTCVNLRKYPNCQLAKEITP